MKPARAKSVVVAAVGVAAAASAGAAVVAVVVVVTAAVGAAVVAAEIAATVAAGDAIVTDSHHQIKIPAPAQAGVFYAPIRALANVHRTSTIPSIHVTVAKVLTLLDPPPL